MTGEPKSTGAAGPAGPADAEKEDGMIQRMTGLFQVTWPAFLGATVGSGILFSAIDPAELAIVDQYLGGSAPGAYTVGFFLLFGVIALSCGMTYLLVRPTPAPDAR